MDAGLCDWRNDLAEFPAGRLAPGNVCQTGATSKTTKRVLDTLCDSLGHSCSPDELRPYKTPQEQPRNNPGITGEMVLGEAGSRVNRT